MKGWNNSFGTNAVFFLTVFLSTVFLAGNGYGNPVVGTRSTVSLRTQPTQASNADKSTPQLSDAPSQTQNPKLDHPEFIQKTQKLHMPFIANKGQVDERVAFYAKTFGGTVFVTKDGDIVYSLPQSGKAEDRSHNVCRSEPTTRRDTVLRVPTTTAVALKEEFIGAKISGIKGEGESITKVSYFKGNDPSKWKSNISTYELVNIGEIYDGIELKLKAHGTNVEKLLYVKPGADPNQIKISLSGLQPSKNLPPLSPSVRGTGACPPLAGVGGGAARGGLESGSGLAASLSVRVPTQTGGLSVNEHGELEVETALGLVKFTKPIAYQEIDGKRVEVAVAYQIEKCKAQNTEYVITHPLPLSRGEYKNLLLGWDSGIGKLNTDNGHDSRIYSFTVASYDKTIDLIIDPLLASTYLGGYGNEGGNSLVLDASGHVYVTGETWSADFPTASGAYDTSFNGWDVFVSKLDSGLTSLLASTYLGGYGDEGGNSLALDTSGNVYVTGKTYSSNFPTTSGAYDTSFNGWDVFVSKLDGGLTRLLASTYLGGSDSDYGYSLALDTSGNVYVTGKTYSSNFPTTSGAYDTSFNDGFYSSDVFVSKLNGGLTTLLASTYLGGSRYDYGNSLTIDTSGNVYVTGKTYSSNFPTTSEAYDTSFNGGYYTSDVFVSKLDGGLTSLLTSTFLGGYDDEGGNSIALDTSGHVYVTGKTGSTNFPTTSGAYDTSFNGSYYDAFVSKLDGGLTSLLTSTFLGGYDDEGGNSIALDTSGHVYVIGETGSINFPTTSGAYDTSFNGSYYDAFVSKLDGGLTRLLASTYLGGSRYDYGNSLTLDTGGHVYVRGLTNSSDFPTTSGAYDTSFNGGFYGDVFVSKLDGNLSAGTAPYINSLSSYLGPHRTLLTINGFNFGDAQGSGLVNFGATTASITSWTDTNITLTIPVLPSKVYDVRVTTNGQTSNSVSFLLTKTPSTKDNFSIELRPSTQTVVRGSSAPYSIFVKPKNGFNEAVTLEVVGLPKGVTAEFQQNPLFPGEWTELTITTMKKTPLKIHSLTLKGSAGNLTHDKTVKLQVRPARPVLNLERTYSSDHTVLLFFGNKRPLEDKIIADISIMNTTGTWIKATLQPESTLYVNDEDYVILLGPYAVKSLGTFTFKEGDVLDYKGDRMSFEPLTIMAIDLFLRGTLGYELPPKAFFNLYSMYELQNTLIGNFIRECGDEMLGCNSLAIDFRNDLREGNALGVLTDLAEYLHCIGKFNDDLQKVLTEILQDENIAKNVANNLEKAVGKILQYLKRPEHAVNFSILMCPSIVPPLDGYFKSLRLCSTLGAPLEGWVRLEALAEEKSNKK